MHYPFRIVSRLLLGATAVLAVGELAAPVGAQTSTSTVTAVQAPDALAQGFAAPPASLRPRCYWYWMDGKITREGITRDLEGMARVGIGEAYIGIIGGMSGDTGPGGVTSFSEEWWQLLEHAIREAGRLGVDIGLFNGPGWSQSGGPWVKPQQSMRYVVRSEMRVRGPQRFEGTLAAPNGAIQDIATLAFPAPTADADSIGVHSPKLSGGEGLGRLFDGDRGTSAPIPAGKSIMVEVSGQFTARSLTVYPAREVKSDAELQVSDDGLNFRGVRKFTIERTSFNIRLGPEPMAPVAVAFPATRARFFRLVFSEGGELGEIVLSGAARVEDYSRKQLSKLFEREQPPFDFYTWPSQTEPESAGFAVPTRAVQDISAKRVGDKVTWDVPAGEWIIQRLAMAPTGVPNVPAPPDATGLEVDKMNRVHLRSHFDAYIGKLLKRMPAADRKAFKHVVVDSYETGSENWTDGFGADFKAHYGYDATPFLPVLSGRIVGSAEQSNRFLWDLRRYVADRVSFDYVGGLRDLSREHGLKAWLENYGHAGFFGEFLQYGGQSEEIGGEFWASPNDTLGNIELRDASSAAHIYGFPVTYAEAWTGGPAFSNTPFNLKRRGDWAFCQGINHFVLHLVIAQPDERRPGISAWFGTEFNRHNTWFNQSKSFFDYVMRCQYMLQQGKYVADVAYFIGEDTPKMSGLQKPGLPGGYSYDFINADVILKRLTVKNGRFTLPDGMSYRLLVIPEGVSMRPETLQKLRDLVAQGGAIMGAPPTKSPSLQNYPASDAHIARLARQLWGRADGIKTQSVGFGKGRVFRGAPLASALQQLNAPPDVVGLDEVSPNSTLFIHRRSNDADIYFISNQTSKELDLTPSFRVTGRAPELWNPETGQSQPLAVYDTAKGRTSVPLHLEADGSAFVVFRGEATGARITKVVRDGKTLAQTSIPSRDQQLAAANAPRSSTFTMSLWVKPGRETPLFPEANSGIIGISAPRNEIIFPTQGEFFLPGDSDAGVGLSVGTNGVTVFEHGAYYFVPILSHATPINDWTHVAIVYKAGQPSLYLNGVLVHSGLQSTHVVHPDEPNRRYDGSFSGFQRAPRALSQAEVAALMKSSVPGAPTAETATLPLQLTRAANGGVQAVAWEAGTYQLQRSSGKPISLSVAPLMPATSIDGAWIVAFPANSGAPASTLLASLGSLTANANPTIKYFSGTASYFKSFDVPASALGADKRLYLDLGQVGSLAEVTLNGKNLGTLWKPPFLLDISQNARVGTNQLDVRVTNAWHNRLVGQRLAPAAFKAPGIEQLWASSFPNYGPNDPLFPSGLIGPVTLREASVTTLR